MTFNEIKDYIPIVSLAISLVSVFITIKVFRIFHRREIQKKQIELVLSLIQNLQTKEVWIRCITSDDNRSGFVSLFSGNIITIAKKVHNQNLKEFGKKYVYLSEELLERIRVNDFLYNPLTPSKIAKSLNQAFSTSITYTRTSEKNQDLIYIDESRTLDAKELDENYHKKEQKYYCSIDVDLNTLIKGLNNFRVQADKWLKKQGIKDLNIYWEEKNYQQHGFVSMWAEVKK